MDRPISNNANLKSGAETTIKTATSIEIQEGSKEESSGNERDDDVVGIRRKVPKGSGVYVKGSIQGVPIWGTVDTGASRSVVSSRIFNKMKRDIA